MGAREEESSPTSQAAETSPASDHVVAGPGMPGETGDSYRSRTPRLLFVAQMLSFAFVLALLALLVWKVAFSESGGRLVSDIKAGKRPAAPAFELGVIWPRDETWPSPLRRALDDHVVSLYELRGHPVVINFWASWCIPCKEEAPHLAAAAKAHRGQLAFLGIDVQDLTADARKFLRDLDVPYVSVRDGTPATYTHYGLTGVPETYYLDRRGRIVAHSIGAVSRAELEIQLAKIAG